jgi:hypothetical protein
MLKKLYEFMAGDVPEDYEIVIYSLYGDPVYHKSISIFRGAWLSSCTLGFFNIKFFRDC